jgi:hypothetical protein
MSNSTNNEEIEATIKECAEKLRGYLANPNLTPYQIGLLIEFSYFLELYNELQKKIADAILEGKTNNLASITALSTNALSHAIDLTTNLAKS